MTNIKKFIDTRYISGEDLLDGYNGLKPEMVVYIDKIEEVETFDQSANKKTKSGGVFLKELNGTPVYKPCIINKTNGRFLIKEFGSVEYEDYYGKPFIMFAQKDSRHGHVVRFKRYTMPVLMANTKDFDNCYKAIHTSGYTMDQIRKKYQVTPEVEALLMQKGGADATI